MLGSEDGLALLESLGQGFTGLSEVLAGETALRGLQRTDRTIRGHEGGLISEDRSSNGLEGVQRVSSCDIGEA